MNFKLAFILLCLSTVLSACSGTGIKPYSSELNNNLQIRVKTSSGSYFSSVKATLAIYQVNKDCTVVYQGTVKLDKPVIDIAIPEARNSYLVFGFASSSFLASNSSSISYDTLLKPRKGYKYEISASYIDNIYNVEIFEIGRKKSTKRQVAAIDLDQCK
jgi:hypothetical protein